MSTPQECRDPEALRRWAIKYVLIDCRLHSEYRHERRQDEAVWPTLHDIYDQAVDRLDRLYGGAATPEEIIDEVEHSDWDAYAHDECDTD